MTDLNNPAPAAPVAGAGSTPLSSAPPAAASSVAVASPAPASSPAPSAGDAVSSALLDLTAAVEAASVAAASVASCPAALLTGALADLALALQDIESGLANVGASVATALPPTAAPPATGTPFVRMGGPWIAGTLYGVVPAAPLTAVPDSNEKWYAITRGKYVGLTRNSAISLNAVNGISSGLSDKCSSQAEALDHFNGALALGAIVVVA